MTSKKIGRPRRSKEAATVRVTVRLTAAEHARIAAAAGELAISDWMRDAALEASVRR